MYRKYATRKGNNSKEGDIRRRLVSQETRPAKTDVKTRGCCSEGSEKRIRPVVISAQGVVLRLSVPLDIETLAKRKLSILSPISAVVQFKKTTIQSFRLLKIL